MKKKVVVLGAEGMLGNTLYKHLKSNKNLIVYGTSRQKKHNYYSFNANSTKNNLKKIFNKAGDIDCVINCIGLLRSYPKKKSPTYSELVKVNASLPKTLERLSKTYKYKLIHISTDDVFSENTSRAIETTKTSPTDTYGKSKLLGEVTNTNSLTIRTSIVGPDDKGKKGLVEWIRSSKDEVAGYTNHKWSGATTKQLSEFIEWLIERKGFEKIKKRTSIIHYAPIGPTTKYALIKDISKHYNKKLIVKRVKSKNEVSRYLVSKYKNVLPYYLLNNSIEHALRELKKFNNSIK